MLKKYLRALALAAQRTNATKQPPPKKKREEKERRRHNIGGRTAQKGHARLTLKKPHVGPVVSVYTSSRALDSNLPPQYYNNYDVIYRHIYITHKHTSHVTDCWG